MMDIILFILFSIAGYGIFKLLCSFGVFGWKAQFLFFNNYKYNRAADLLAKTIMDNADFAKLDSHYITVTVSATRHKIWIANRWYGFASKVGAFNDVRISLEQAIRLKELMEHCATNGGEAKFS